MNRIELDEEISSFTGCVAKAAAESALGGLGDVDSDDAAAS